MLQRIIIEPLIGINGLQLGKDMSDVVDIIGEPDERSSRQFPDESEDKTWEYSNIGLSLTFSSDDDWKLGVITVEAADAELSGHCFIGLEEKVFLDQIEEARITPTVLDDDFRELGSKDYKCDRLGLSFWIQDGKVSSITIFPKYDESGEVPLWPEE